MKTPFLYTLIAVALLQYGCASAPKGFAAQIGEQLHTSPVLANSHAGVAVYDLTAQKMVFEQNAERYFTPASNTKLFSFFAGLKNLGDSIPALRYVQRGDSLIVWGTGDPSLLHPDLKSTRAYTFLKNSTQKIFLSTTNSAVIPTGSGWTIDDYNDYYQAEVSPLPIYGNIVRFTGNAQQQIQATPNYFIKNCIQKSDNQEVIRDFSANNFTIPITVKSTFEQDVPFRTSYELTAKLLEDTLHKSIQLLNEVLPVNANTLYSMPTDSVYKRMLHVSDNMLAEHLMVLTAGAAGERLSVATGIEHTIKNYLTDLTDKPQWIDGAGLSRYNLFTPRDLVQLLQKIYVIVPQERLFTLLAAGGKTGTIKRMFKNETPYVFAKSGSLRNNYNLSGYVLTNSGKVLIFSFMNNNFTQPVSEIRKEVERFLQWIHLNY